MHAGYEARGGNESQSIQCWIYLRPIPLSKQCLSPNCLSESAYGILLSMDGLSRPTELGGAPQCQEVL